MPTRYYQNICSLRHWIGVCFGWALVLPLCAEPTDKGLDFFEQRIRPILADHCYQCHSARSEKLKGGLLLDDRDGLLKGGDGGPVIDLEHPEKSRLLEAVTYNDPDLQMPPKKQLAAAQVADLAAWIKMGAPDPRANSAASGANSATAQKPAYDYQEARKWWAFQPVKTSPPPEVKNKAWGMSPVDDFILARLESKNLAPAAQADKPALIRRATFDLTGLPPTPEEINAFVADSSPDAFAKVVDRLLASPAYGQRWARHWLDVVRYADARDLIQLPVESDFREIWRYRDWVVSAFNKDMPYDQFVISQIAGDLIQPSSPQEINKDALVATGLLALADFVPGDNDKEQMIADYVNDEIDVVGRCFLGLTLACARCHDHKFDPISTEDYYGMAGIFFSSRIIPSPVPGNTPLVRTPLLPKAELESIEIAKKRSKVLKRVLASATDRAYRDNLGNLVVHQTSRYLKAALDYTHLTNDAPIELKEFARQNQLEDQFLSQWLDYLGIRNYRLFSSFQADAEGVPGVGVWSGKEAQPAIAFNAGDALVQWKKRSLPPGAVAFCPDKTNSAVIGWKSPFNGAVSLAGKVKYTDPTKGLGVAIALELKVPGGRSGLASATIPNGGDLAMENFSGAGRLKEIAVQAGDFVELSVTSKGDPEGLALVEWTISENGGDRVWDLAQDLGRHLEKGTTNNPRPDAYAHAETWHLLDSAGAKPAPGEPRRLNTALAAWRESARAVTNGKADPSAMEKSAQEIEQALRAEKMQADNAIAQLSPAQKTLAKAELIKLQARNSRLFTAEDGQVIQWLNRAGIAMENAAPVPNVPSPAKAEALINGKSRPVLRFSGREMLQVAEKAPPEGSLFVVCKVAEKSPSGQRLLGWEDSDVGRHGLGLMMEADGGLRAVIRKDGVDGDISSTEKAEPEFETLSITWGPHGTTLHRNQKSLGASAQLDSLTSDPAIESLKIGGPGSGSSPKFQGDLAELRVYDQQLDDAARQAVENELTAAWFGPESKEELPPTPAEALYAELASVQGPYRLKEGDKTKWLPAEMAAGLKGQKEELETLDQSIPAHIPVAVVVEDGGPKETKHAGFNDSPIFIRGNPKNTGRIVPRGFPRVLAGDSPKPITQGSGRLELAQWIASRDNPLTARIMVNRVWQHHFGDGIVRTPNNFGKRGELPTHPELLDYLADRFIESGWSIKQLHRAIMLSSVYQESSRASAELLAADPENSLFGRMNRRPLDAEAMRDSLLAVAGRLDLKEGGAGFQELDNPRRTLYLMSVRTGVTNGFTPLFDRPDGTTIIEKRNTSTVAPQALFLLNDPFIMAQATALAARIKQNNPTGGEAGMIQNLYELALGRAPTPEELELGFDFLAQKEIKDPWGRYCQIMLCSTEFATVE